MTKSEAGNGSSKEIKVKENGGVQMHPIENGRRVRWRRETQEEIYRRKSN